MRKLDTPGNREELVHKISQSACGASERLKRFTAGVIEGKSMQQAALDAGFAPSTAAVASRVLMPRAKITFRQILEHYAPLGRQARKIAEGMDATKKSYFSFEGHVVDSREDADYVTRHKYLELAAKMQGFMADEEKQSPGPAITVQFVSMGSPAPSAIPAKAEPSSDDK